MKPMFIIPLVLMSLVSFPSWGLTMDDLVQRMSVFYKQFTDVPFTGEIDEGKYRGSLKNGKRDGFWLVYYDNGQLKAKGHFRNGIQEGYWESYWDNGQLFTKGNSKNGKQEGFWEWFNEDGTVDTELTGTYKNGVKVSD